MKKKKKIELEEKNIPDCVTPIYLHCYMLSFSLSTDWLLTPAN